MSFRHNFDLGVGLFRVCGLSRVKDRCFVTIDRVLMYWEDQVHCA